MHTQDHPVGEILRQSCRFMVPIYQRRYQWDDKQLIPFWDDVSTKAEEILDKEVKFEHYMGALILAPVESEASFAFTPIMQVVDGQQRLTTFQIFLSALREVARNHDQNHFTNHIKSYLMNVPESKDTDELARFKLTPTPPDRNVFHDIIELTSDKADKKYEHLFWGKKIPKNCNERAYRAYYLFRHWIENFIQDVPQNFDGISEEPEDIEDEIDEDIIEKRLDALLNALLNRLKLVVITLGESDDAQVIFETLNSKGEPLLAMDLVRNNIFHRAERQEAKVETLYEKLWKSFEDAWWRAPAPNARPRRPRLDHFLAHTLVAETGQKISIRELYAEYRDFTMPKGRPRFENVTDELELLERYAPIYRTLEGLDACDPSLRWLGRKLATWQVSTVYPVAMQIGQEDAPIEEKVQLAKLIYSYLVRRTLCHLTMKNLNQVFQSIAADFLEHGLSVNTFKNYFLKRRDNISIFFPTDHQVRHSILAENAYAVSPPSRLRDILWELEQASRTEFSEQIEQPKNLSVEHVMPQSWGNDWPYEDDSIGNYYDEDTRAKDRNKILHTLGNLTLLSGNLNISSSNKDFNYKKEKFANHTGLFLNKWFRKKSRWTEQEIHERSEKLADISVKHWVGL